MATKNIIRGEFSHKGSDAQKATDIVIDLRRVDTEEVAKWSPEQKDNLLRWLGTFEEIFKVFCNEIKTGAKTEQQ